MTHSVDVDKLESEVYRSRFSDGSIEIYLGVSLTWIGIAWMFLPAVSGLAGILPAIFVAPFVAWRTRFLEQRVGYVRFGSERRSWERRNVIMMLLAGLFIFALGISVYVIGTSAEADTTILTSIAPGLIAFLLAAIASGIAIITGTWRMLVIAAVLIAGGIFAAINDANPGLPLIPAGAIAAIWGTVMLVMFVKKHPKVEQVESG